MGNKTTGEALWEIYVHHGFPPLHSFEDFKQDIRKMATDLKEGREIDQEKLMGAAQIINENFYIEIGPIIKGIVQYKDHAKNVYHEEWECLQSLLDGSYNKMTGEGNG